MEINNKRRFSVGDIVSVTGYQENFVVMEWNLDASYHKEDGYYEHSTYTLKGLGTNRYLDAIDEHDENIKMVQSIKANIDKLTPEEVDILLDKYNEYTEIHNLLQSLGVSDDEYKTKANEIINYLNKQAS